MMGRPDLQGAHCQKVDQLLPTELTKLAGDTDRARRADCPRPAVDRPTQVGQEQTVACGQLSRSWCPNCLARFSQLPAGLGHEHFGRCLSAQWTSLTRRSVRRALDCHLRGADEPGAPVGPAKLVIDLVDPLGDGFQPIGAVIDGIHRRHHGE